MPIAASMFYALLGTVVAEFLMTGVNQLFIRTNGQELRFAIEICVFFFVFAIILDPLSASLKAKLDRDSTGPGRTRLSSGVLAVGIALVFVGFNIIAANDVEAIGTYGLMLVVHMLLVFSISPLITFAWIIGHRQTRRRAAIFGGLAGCLIDALALLSFWAATGALDGRLVAVSRGTAFVAAFGGGLQAGFYGFCGGLAIDWARASNPIHYIGLALFAAITLWTVGYGAIGGWYNLPGADLMTRAETLFINFADYAGLVLGLTLCPKTAAAFKWDLESSEAKASDRVPVFFLVMLGLVTAGCLAFFLMTLRQPQDYTSTTAGKVLAFASGTAWVLSALVGNLWNARLNILAGLCAIGSAGLLAPR